MSGVAVALEALLGELTRRGSPLARHLRPGLSEDCIRSRMRNAGALPHPDVIALFHWHDGFDRFQVPVSPNGLVSLMPSHPEFNPLDEILEVYTRWRDMAEKDATIPVRHIDGIWRTPSADDLWPREWFPIFEGGGSELIFISNAAGEPGSVWLHPVQDAPRRIYRSLAEACESVRLALEDGRLALDPAGVYSHESYKSSGLEI